MLVLCLNLGRTYTFHCQRKSKRPSKWLGFLVNVWFWSALTLTLNQRVRSSSLRRLSTRCADMRRQEKLTYPYIVRIVVPPPKLRRTDEPGLLGPLPVLQTLRDKEPFYRHGGIQKERVIVPWAGRRRWVMGVSGSDAPVLDGLPLLSLFQEPINRRAQSGLHLGLVHRFWTILGGILAGFIVLEQVFQGFHLWDSVQAELLKVAGQGVHQPALVAIELA